MSKRGLRVLAGLLAIIMFAMSVTDFACINAKASEMETSVNQDLEESPQIVTVSFNANGGRFEAGQNPYFTVSENKSLEDKGIIDFPTVSRNGYDFVGWYYDNGSFEKVASLSDVVSKEDATDGVIYLYACWEKAKNQSNEFHSIEYVLNDGYFEEDVVFEYEEGFETTLPTPIKPGYRFDGWYLDESFLTKIEAITAEDNKDVCVYAKWTAYTYKLVFKADSDVKGEMSTQLLTYDKAATLRRNRFTKSGYSFACWSVSGNMTQRYLDTETVTNIITPEYDGQVVTLEAQFQPNDDTAVYYVKFYNVMDGGEPVEATKDECVRYNLYSTYRANFQLGLPKDSTMKKTGYMFEGWYTDKNCRNKLKLTSKTNKNLVIYMKWSTWNYKVKFIKLGGRGVMNNFNVLFGEEKRLPKNTLSKKGYTFAGWALTEAKAKRGIVDIEDQGYVELIENNVAKKNQTVKIYPVWEANINNINYVNNVGDVEYAIFAYKTGSAYSYKPLCDNTVITNLPSYAKTTDFAGWYLDKNYKKKACIKKTSTDELTFYSKWKIAYTINFDKGITGVNGEALSKEYNYGVRKRLPSNKFTRKGYTFEGWAVVSANGCSVKTGVSANELSKEDIVFANRDYVSGFDLSYFTIENNKPVLKLVPVWAKAHTITFVTNGGTLDKEGVSFNGTNYTLSCNYGKAMTAEEFNNNYKAEKAGYTFTGWFSDAALTKPFEITEATVGDITVYAGWVGKNAKVTYHSNFGVDKIKNQSIKYGKESTIKKNSFKRNGYIFIGWGLSENATEAYLTEQEPVRFDTKAVSDNYISVSDNTISDKLDLYAVWEVINYDAVFVDIKFGRSYIYTYTIETGLDLNKVKESLNNVYPNDYALENIYTNKNKNKLANSIPRGKKGDVKKGKIFYIDWNEIG